MVLLINAAMPAAISHITLHGVKIFDGKFSAMDVRDGAVGGRARTHLTTLAGAR